MNLDYNAKLSQAYQKVVSHEVFAGVEKSIASPCDFQLAKYKNDMAESGSYRCNGPCFAGGMQVDDDNPASETRTLKWKERYYNVSSTQLDHSMNFTFKFGVIDGQHDITKMEVRGKLPMVSPAEPFDALVLRIAEVIDDANAGPEELGVWLKAVMQAPVMFIKYKSESDCKRARITDRESFGVTYELLYRAPFDRILGAAQFK